MAASDGGCEGYRAAGVVFFTREAGQVGHVLLALEERRVSARQLGLPQGGAGVGAGKEVRDVVVFPQGRRERKDEGDPIETAMREYHEETGNFGALTEHLLRFYEDDAETADTAGPSSAAAVAGESAVRQDAASAAQRQCLQVACAQSFIMYFGHARMVVVFCEVPGSAYERSLRPLNKADISANMPLQTQDAGELPAEKRRKTSTTSYHVGKENHLTPVWVTAEALRAAVTSLDCNSGSPQTASIEVTICPRQSIDGTGKLGTSGHGDPEGVRRVVPFFPLNFSVFRRRDARIWLGLPALDSQEFVNVKETDEPR